MSVQLQWNLDYSVGSALSVARGIFRAATCDNVQPLAILACERFGNTIAMCQDTCRKMEHLVTKTTQPVSIQFLRVSVGFPYEDTASQLAKSLAGVRFLGLAAALVMSLGAYEGASALEAMLQSSASDKTLLPTARQLKGLLTSLEPRCQRSGFGDAVLGWQIFLCQSPGVTTEDHNLWKVSTFYPSPQGVDKLVDAFRQLARIGESTTTKVIIRTNVCTPWVIAFTKWCLGVPPSVYTADGTSILEQPDSQVTLIACMSSDKCTGFEVSIHRSLAGPSDLIATDFGRESWAGLVSIETYGQWFRQKYDLATGTAYRAITQALPYATRQILTTLKFSDYRMFDPSTHIRNWPKRKAAADCPVIDKDLQKLGLSPFRNDSAVSRMVSRIFGLQDPVELCSLDNGILIADLPVVRLHLQMLQQSCSCTACLSSRAQSHDSSTSYRACDRQTFFQILARIIADILALSLFENSDSLLIMPKHDFSSTRHPLSAAVHSILTEGSPVTCSILALHEWALAMVGHRGEDDVDQSAWVMSYYKGQVVYPAVFETHRFEKRGYLSLSCLPGLLRYEGDTYARVVADASTFSSDPLTGSCDDAVLQPCNLIPGARLAWRVARGDNILKASIGLEGIQNYSQTKSLPTTSLINLASALLVEACPHHRNSPLNCPDPFCFFTGPLDPMVSRSDSTREGQNSVVQSTGVVAVDGADDLRWLALAAYEMPVILRRDACLSCCLDVSRITNYPVIIL